MMGSRGGECPTILACIVCAVASCKREPKPLAPPDPATRAIELSWRMGTELPDGTIRPSHAFELALAPDRRFRYRWRNLWEPAPWKEIAGSWDAAGERKWVLRPDLGSASLEGGDQDTFPVLKWSKSLAAAEPDGPDFTRGAYRTPVVDVETGRFFTNRFAIQSDPRALP